ncbi:FMN reductase (NADPH) [Paramyrothecium foliicola]|nr:FMN reductase (NADPH) [Paramyrothecium foliicola]
MSVSFDVFRGSAKGRIVPDQVSRTLQPHEVYIETTHSGVCGTDEHYIKKGQVLGHEGIGIVKQLGSGVTTVKPGDRVGFGYTHEICANCDNCATGWDQYCRNRKLYGFHDVDNGSFSSGAVWDSKCVYRIPDGYESIHAAPLMCAGATVWTILSEYDVRAGQRVGILGIGGLGHLAIKLAAAIGCHVVVLSSSESKRQEAMEYGASEFHVFQSGGRAPEDIKSVKHLLLCGSASLDYASLLPLVDTQGSIYPLTVTLTPAPIPLLPMGSRGIKIQGSLVASRQAIRNLLEFASRKNITPTVMTFPFTTEGIEDAMQKLRNGKINKFAREALGFSSTEAINLLMIANGASIPIRPVVGYAADHMLGSINSFILATISLSAVSFAWVSINSRLGIYTFSVFFGIANGACQGAFLGADASLTQDPLKLGTRFGMIQTVIAFSILAGPPTAGAIIDDMGGRFVGAQVWGGSMVLTGTLPCKMGSVENNRFSSLLEARYQDGQSTGLKGPLNPVIETILCHKSHRKFLSQGLEPGTLEALVAAGSSASTSSLLQTWGIVAVQDPEHKKALATLAGDQDFIRQAPLFLIFVADLNRITKVCEKAGSKDVGLEMLDMFIMPTIDCALVAQNINVAAESLGLGTCYVGAIRNNCRQVCDTLKLPNRTVALFGMAIGHPDPTEHVSIKPRLGISAVLHREVWNDEDEQERLESYNKALGRFYEMEGDLVDRRWRAQQSNRAFSPHTDDESDATPHQNISKEVAQVASHPFASDVTQALCTNLFDTSDELEIGLIHYFEHVQFPAFLLPNVSPDFLAECRWQYLDMAKRSDCVKKSIVACCASNRSVLTSDSRFARLGLKYYAEAISCANSIMAEISVDDREPDECLLAAVVFFYLYELWGPGQAAHAIQHVTGAIRIFSLRHHIDPVQHTSCSTPLHPIEIPIHRLITESILYQSLMLSLRYPFAPTYRMDVRFLSWVERALQPLWNRNAATTQKTAVLGLPPQLYHIILDTIDLQNSPEFNKKELARLQQEMHGWEDYASQLHDESLPMQTSDELVVLYILAASLLLDRVSEVRRTASASTLTSRSGTNAWPAVEPTLRWQVVRALSILRAHLAQQTQSLCYLGSWPLMILGYAVHTHDDISTIKQSLTRIWRKTGYGEIKRISDELDEVWRRRSVDGVAVLAKEK